jgi:hypothetical protein
MQQLHVEVLWVMCRLREAAEGLVEHWNLERAEDVLRIAADATGAKFEELSSAQLLWIDRLGMYLYIQVSRRTSWSPCDTAAAATAAVLESA